MRPAASTFNYRQILVVLVVAWVARYLFALWLPPEARSADIYSWEVVAQTLVNGGNPYQETPALNWPPFWMQVVYLMAKASQALNVPLMLVLRVFLTAVESLVMVLLFQFIRQIAPQARPLVPVLLGIALNPTTIILTCQHGNFDVIVGLWVLLFVGQLIRFHNSGKDIDWLAACLFLGLGILTKTVPLVLCPLLAGGWRRVARNTKWIGAALLLGPVILGMSVIYVLAPDDVATKVLGYRSATGWFGISGLLCLWNGSDWIDLSKILFYLLLAAAGVLTTIAFWRREKIEAREILLCAIWFLTLIPGLGPGYSPQYLYWFLPLLVASWFVYDRIWRWTLAVFGIVTALTCIAEYAIVPSHGAYLYFMIKEGRVHLPPMLANHLDWWMSQAGEIVMRLPLFVAFLALLAVGGGLLIRKPRAGTPTPN